jgi:hypothetical protein
MSHVLTRLDEVEGWRGEIRDNEVVTTHEEALEEERRALKESEGEQAEQAERPDEAGDEAYEEDEYEDEYADEESPEEDEDYTSTSKRSTATRPTRNRPRSLWTRTPNGRRWRRREHDGSGDA